MKMSVGEKMDVSDAFIIMNYFSSSLYQKYMDPFRATCYVAKKFVKVHSIPSGPVSAEYFG